MDNDDLEQLLVSDGEREKYRSDYDVLSSEKNEQKENPINVSQDLNNSLLQMHRAKEELVKEKEALQTISANLYDFVDPNNNNIHEYIDNKVE